MCVCAYHGGLLGAPNWAPFWVHATQGFLSINFGSYNLDGCKSRGDVMREIWLCLQNLADMPDDGSLT